MIADTRTLLDFGALQPGVGVFGGVRRFLEIGNELVRRGHRYVLYHPSGEPPDWLAFHGDVKPLTALRDARHQVLLCNDPPLLEDFEAAHADVKLFYCVLEKIRDERHIARHPGWTILANSSGIAKRLQRKYRVQVEPVIGGIDLDLFQPRPVRPNADQPFRVLGYGRASRRAKGVPLVVRAAETFARRLGKRREVQLVLFDHVGPGNEDDPRPQLKTALPLDFRRNTPQEDLAALYSSCDVFVSAERKAGWCNTVCEAMACGVPVVCTRSGTLDLARHLKTAWVVRWRNPWSLSRGLRALHDDPRLRTHLRESALRHVQQFTWKSVVDQLEDVVRRKLG